MSITRGALRLLGGQLDREGMTVPLAWLGKLGAGKFAQGVAGCCLLCVGTLSPVWGGPCLLYGGTLSPPCPPTPSPCHD